LSKATNIDVKKLGFTLDMFTAVASAEAEFHDIIDGVLDELTDEVKYQIGTTAYDDAANLADVKRIEKYLAAAELWTRRAAIVQGNAISA